MKFYKKSPGIWSNGWFENAASNHHHILPQPSIVLMGVLGKGVMAKCLKKRHYVRGIAVVTAVNSCFSGTYGYGFFADFTEKYSIPSRFFGWTPVR
jgi:hypothetical protein